MRTVYSEKCKVKSFQRQKENPAPGKNSKTRGEAA